MTRRFAIYLTLSFALVLNAGCVAQLAQTAGQDLGAPLGSRLADQLPTPHANTPTTVKGGNWCDVQEALGFPRRPTRPEINAMSHDDLVALVAVNEQGEKRCGWKP